MTPEQRAAIDRAVARGITDPAALYAAAGVAPPPTLSDFATNGAMSAAPVAPPPPVAPVGGGFVDQGGLLGLAARTPGSQQALQGLGWFGENIAEPVVTGMITAAQNFIPGTQMIERVSDEAAQAARDRGVSEWGPDFLNLTSDYLGSKAAGGGAFDQPVTTGLGINIPGPGIPLDWLAGRGAKLDEIDVGRLIPELLIERGAFLTTRPLRYAAANKMSSPLLAKAIYPEVLKSKTLAGQQKLFDSPVAPGSAATPITLDQPVPPMYVANSLENNTEIIARNIEEVESTLPARVFKRDIDRVNARLAANLAAIPDIRGAAQRFNNAQLALAKRLIPTLIDDIFGKENLNFQRVKTALDNDARLSQRVNGATERLAEATVDARKVLDENNVVLQGLLKNINDIAYKDNVIQRDATGSNAGAISIIGYNKNWRVTGSPRGIVTPFPGPRTSETQSIINELRELAGKVDKAQKQVDIAEGKVKSLTVQSGSNATKHILVRKLVDIRQRRSANANPSKGGQFYDYKDAARRILTKVYSPEAGGVTGLDLLQVAVNVKGGVAKDKADLLRALALNMEDIKTRAKNPTSAEGIAARKLMSDTEKLPNRQFPLDVDTEVATLIKTDLSRRRKVDMEMAAAEDARITSFAEGRNNPGQGQSVPPRSAAEPKSESAIDPAPNIIPDEPKNIPSGGRKYLSGKGTSLAAEVERLAVPMTARFAEWLSDQRMGGDVGFFSLDPGGFSSAALKSTGGKTFAWLIDNTVGAVKPHLVRQSKVFLAFSAYARRASNIRAATKSDVDNFFVDALGVEPDEVANTIARVFPVDVKTGLWGETGVAAWDAIEAYWAHVQFNAARSTDPSASNSYLRDIARYVKNRPAMKAQFFYDGTRRLSPEEVTQKFDDFFRESKSFIDELKVYHDELRDLWKDSLTPEELVKYNKMIHTGLGTALPREIGRVTKPDGTPIFDNATFSTQYSRLYDEISAAHLAGEVYNYNIKQVLENLAFSVGKLDNNKDLRELLIDAGIAIPTIVTDLDGALIPGLLGRYLGYFSNEGKDALTGEMSKAINGFKTRTEKALKTHDDEMAALNKKMPNQAADGYDEAFNKIDEKRIKAIKAIEKDIIDNINSQKSGFSIPSNQWWANHQDRVTPTALLDSFGIKDNPTKDALPAALRTIGLGDVSLFQRKQVRDIEQALNLVDSLVLSNALPGMKPGKLTNLIHGGANWWRLSSTGFDFAFPVTVGLPLLFRNPAQWLEVAIQSTRYAFDGDVLASVLRRDPEILPYLRRMRNEGHTFGDVEVYKFLEKGPEGKVRLDAEAFDAYITKAPIPSDAALTGVRRGVGALSWMTDKFQRSYNLGSILNKYYWLKTFEPQYSRIQHIDGVPTTIVDHLGLRKAVDSITASLNITGMGRSVKAKQLENLFVGLSPRLTRSIATLVLDAQRGTYLIGRSSNRRELLTYARSQGRSGKSPLQAAQDIAGNRSLTVEEVAKASAETRQLLALGNLSTTLAATMSSFFMLNYIYAKTQGLSDDEAMERATASLDPRQGKKFLSVEVNGTWIGIGGFWRTLVQLNTQLLTSAAGAVQGDWKPLQKFKAWDRFDNPLLALYSNRGAPAVEFLGKAIEGASGSLGVIPIDAAPYDILDNAWDIPISFAKSFAPFSIQGVIDGEGKESFFFGMAGARTGDMSFSDGLVNMARRSLKVDVDNPKNLPETWVKRDVLYPKVTEQYQIAASASNSSFGLFQARKAELKFELISEMAAEFAGSNTDYELVSMYYEKQRVMNARLDEYEKIVGVGSFDIDYKNPIAVALHEWRKIYDSADVTNALKNERWDLIESLREDLMKKFTPEQQEAVLRSGGGIPLEIVRLLKPESQQRYLTLYNRRTKWLTANAQSPEIAQELANLLWENMFPPIDVPRGVTQAAINNVSSGI